MPKDLNLGPAYGRSYLTLDAAQRDWNDGKDFQILNLGPDHGRYCSSRDFDILAESFDAVVIVTKCWPHSLRIKLS